jgi:peptide/nickel transport system ATP-binding protein
MNLFESKEVLRITDLKVHYPTDRGTVRAVRGLDLTVHEGEILGLVGESGCGKSAALFAVMGLLPYPGRIAGGKVLLNGRDMASLGDREIRAARGSIVSMVFQDPMSTLNPSHKIGAQLKEALVVHGMWRHKDRRSGREALASLLAEVGIPSPETVLDQYPHQLSGGMQQRVMIAIALACRPSLILADEPTTALDVTIEAQILDLLRRVNRENGTAIVLVTHNLAVASQFCDRIAVMYAGQIVEEGPVRDVLSAPLHPYTQGLLECIPRFSKVSRLTPIPGSVPDLIGQKMGCSFHGRCKHRARGCQDPDRQELVSVGGGRAVRCWRWTAIVATEETLDEVQEMVVDSDRD